MACETLAEGRDPLCCLAGPGAALPQVFEGLDKAVKIKKGSSSAFLERPQLSGSSHSATPEGRASWGVPLSCHWGQAQAQAGGCQCCCCVCVCRRGRDGAVPRCCGALIISAAGRALGRGRGCTGRGVALLVGAERGTANSSCVFMS